MFQKSQNSNEFAVTSQAKLFPSSEKIAKYEIQDDLLFNCIGLGNHCSTDELHVSGFNSGKESGYVLLAHFVSMALGIKRLPYCEDRIYTEYCLRFQGDRYKKLLLELDESRIRNICDEIKHLYAHTQKQLGDKGLKTVSLRRELRDDDKGYVASIVALKRAADLCKRDHVSFEMDTLNSFGDQGAYCRDVALEVNIPIENVLYCSSLVGNRPNRSVTMETGEWVIVNKSPTGVVEVPTSSIVIRNDRWKDESDWTEERAQRFLDNHNPVVLRYAPRHLPCTRSTPGLKPTWKRLLLQRLLVWISRS